MCFSLGAILADFYGALRYGSQLSGTPQPIKKGGPKPPGGVPQTPAKAPSRISTWAWGYRSEYRSKAASARS